MRFRVFYRKRKNQDNASGSGDYAGAVFCDSRRKIPVKVRAANCRTCLNRKVKCSKIMTLGGKLHHEKNN